MASLIESPQVAFVAMSEHPASSKRPAPSPFSFSRLVLPFIGVAIGMSLGFATGFTLALVNAPNEIVAASSGATQASLTSHASSAPLAANFSQPAAATVHSIADSAVAKAHAKNATQIALNKMPDAVKPAMFKLGGKEWRVAMPIAIPVAQPIRQGLASTPAAASTATRAQRG
jgi:hypothetical protein